MISIDMTTISRFENSSKKLVEKILSPEEYKLWDKKDAKFLAVRWAIKEALYKVNNSLASFNKITISHDGKKYFYNNEYHISTSDEKDLLIAIVLKEKKC